MGFPGGAAVFRWDVSSAHHKLETRQVQLSGVARQHPTDVLLTFGFLAGVTWEPSPSSPKTLLAFPAICRADAPITVPAGNCELGKVKGQQEIRGL